MNGNPVNTEIMLHRGAFFHIQTLNNCSVLRALKFA